MKAKNYIKYKINNYINVLGEIRKKITVEEKVEKCGRIYLQKN